MRTSEQHWPLLPISTIHANVALDDVNGWLPPLILRGKPRPFARPYGSRGPAQNGGPDLPADRPSARGQRDDATRKTECPTARRPAACAGVEEAFCAGELCKRPQQAVLARALDPGRLRKLRRLSPPGLDGRRLARRLSVPGCAHTENIDVVKKLRPSRETRDGKCGPGSMQSPFIPPR